MTKSQAWIPVIVCAAVSLFLVCGCSKIFRNSLENSPEAEGWGAVTYPDEVSLGGASLNGDVAEDEEYDVSVISTSRPEAKPEPAMLASAPERERTEYVRLMIYRAVVNLVADNIEDTLADIKSLSEQEGGYMQALGTDVIVIKVPASSFERTLEKIESMGKVTSKEIQAEDVTEQMRDLRIRLENAEEFRKRLLLLLDKATKVEDILKIEKELERITSDIELLKGKIKSIQQDISYSTITVYVNSEVSQDKLRRIIPFPWVRELGAELAQGTSPEYAQSQPLISRGGIRFELPDSYVMYFQRNYKTRAMSAENVLIKLDRHQNFEGGDQEFWSKLARRQLLEARALMLDKEEDLRLESGAGAMLIPGHKIIGGEKYGYMAALVVTDDYVYTYECWGPYEEFMKDKSSIVRSIQSMKIRTSRQLY